MKLLLLFFALIGHAQTNVVRVVVNGPRTYQYTGTITLHDPASHRVLGTYAFASGGAHRGSAPFGLYRIGKRDEGKLGITWAIGNPWRDDGEADDPWTEHDKKDKPYRYDLLIHSLEGEATWGCIGILGGKKVYRRFVKQMDYVTSFGPIVFIIGGDDDEHATVLSTSMLRLSPLDWSWLSVPELSRP